MLNRVAPVKMIWGWERERENNFTIRPRNALNYLTASLQIKLLAITG